MLTKSFTWRLIYNIPRLITAAAEYLLRARLGGVEIAPLEPFATCQKCLFVRRNFYKYTFFLSAIMRVDDLLIAVAPLLPSLWLLINLGNESLRTSLFISTGIAISGFFIGNSLIPVVAEHTLRRGLAGKDLGKKGSDTESRDVPEALGLVTGTVFLICAIFSQLIFAKTFQQLMVYNSALFSVCFMIFLGFTDDTLDLKWRYKLVLPTVASLPLLTAYSGSTAIYIPSKLQQIFMANGQLTIVGRIVDVIATVDTEANGAIIELGYLFLIFMGLLSVFCTNSINILAGINGLECGQAYIIAASILFFKLFEMSRGQVGENQMFAVIMILPFIGSSLALLRHNWFPAQVFVGDTFCYFAGMTFAVVGIHGHFSKTLLLLFAPQIINFLYSIPQLFKLMPCPRHRLPRIDPVTRLMHPSTFPCNADQFKLFKVKASDTECPNCTLICLTLRLFGPMRERSLCLTLLAIQTVASIIAFYIRYSMLENDNV